MKINIKNIRIKSICATLFISLFLSCNNAGPELRDGQAATADGAVIDLRKISEKIGEVIAFSESVKEIEALIKSIDELAKGIGKKIQSSDLASDSDKNNSLLSGVYSLALDIIKRSKALRVSNSLQGKGLDTKISAVTTSTETFVSTLKSKNSVLGVSSGAATDDNAQKAIDRIKQSSGENGASELVKINTAIDALVDSTQGILKSVVKELTATSDKAETIKVN
ncbi:hypothetical protein bcCo53_001639 (plasmid) [Borrelia coriaceae]|uniref:Variable outer membrane protein n=1 Tax=Borrelia coriaceae ATCC 43381 TaxID=1408429 RepID=W5SX21_9SPIR|nr:Vsp/OspC family lipoprotein [Borrelia coriaceae]AHH11253.1 Variable outer membrane protein [Borrelia coriaceae ATCC 43381]UPA17439.1 hypothetical protein bcCo53_001639 [Borrelia coriaceae]